VPAWQYIVTRVQQEYPETIFLLEGLGGAWEATEALLTEGGMQWAYSELFQNYSGLQVSGYLDHSLRESERVGLLVHYSETHDNERLAARGGAWSLLRNRLCALASVSGGFGFTCGVEWLASEKIRVHGSTGMAWGQGANLLPELARLNQLLRDHPCFFDGAKLTRLSPADAPVYALLRESQEGKDRALVLVNTDVEQANPLTLALDGVSAKLSGWSDLLGQTVPEMRSAGAGKLQVTLEPGAAYCLAPTSEPVGLHGEAYRQARMQSAWGLTALSRLLPAESIGPIDWRWLAQVVARSPERWLATISSLSEQPEGTDLAERLNQAVAQDTFPRVVTWNLLDRRRITPVPPQHWLLLQDTVPFRAALNGRDGSPVQNVEAIPVREHFIACFAPRPGGAEATLWLERYADQDRQVQAAIRFLPAEPEVTARMPRPTDLVLLTNGRGGMARICVDLGRVLSKYDCVLGANLHPTLPVDRHVFAKRIRVWVNADGFISPLDFRSLVSFEAGPPAIWNFVANAGDGRTVEIQMTADMLEGRNTTVFHFSRPTVAQASGKQLPAKAEVRLTVRLDIEDRSYHGETQRNGGAEYHFSTHVQTLATGPEDGQTGGAACEVGFAFTPAADRTLRVVADSGNYNPEPEWSHVDHPVEQSRGQVGGGDAYSPGWFELPLVKGAIRTLVVSADRAAPEQKELESIQSRFRTPSTTATAPDEAAFHQQLLRAARAFVVQRGSGKTVIAGYPWFLDWGRDTFISARGLLAAGMLEEVKQVLVTFARFEKEGTLPNTIFGENASNRDTSDAPLWFGIVCEELAATQRASGSEVEDLYATPVNAEGRTLCDVLQSIAFHYSQGTPNRIRMDPDSGLVWSPSHFTWMDTNYPAGTPREGYPVEIQALWIRLLQQVARIGPVAERSRWERLAAQAQASLEQFFWREDRGYYADVVRASAGQSAAQGVIDDALRSNCLFVVSLGLSRGTRARRCVEAVRRHLVVPGALRSLAPLPVSVPLPVYGNDGRLLNNPYEPYWGHYEGDEDTHRKPAYHNGTGWTWTFPVFCEAMARAWDFAPEALAAARAYLGSMERLMAEGCIGHIPENVDGDAPHYQRGCDAQAWGATEALRVWLLLGESR
ncbi:MAG TPA: amylo-alpha-1,6-glucosidase, partial [Candidatus Sulfotelmatobacter sp.]|nr:amylo-alpha-1,6-glucosidase [Candidatus Sulfotelmatobacter sp.]